MADLKGQNLDLNKNNEMLGLVNTLANNRKTTEAFTMNREMVGKKSAMTKSITCTASI